MITIWGLSGQFVTCGWHKFVTLTHGVGSAWASPSRSTPPRALTIASPAAPEISARCMNFLIILLLLLFLALLIREYAEPSARRRQEFVNSGCKVFLRMAALLGAL
jgi:hypothetical protein